MSHNVFKIVLSFYCLNYREISHVSRILKQLRNEKKILSSADVYIYGI